MEPIEKRKVSEVITLYMLHPEFRDIYVEGVTDRLVFERFLHKKQVQDFQVLEIDDLDFSDHYYSNPDLPRNNKKKLTFLSQELENSFPTSLKGITCICDKDFDEFTNEIINNKYLFYTDFTCLEMYLFNTHVLKIFYRSILRKFPITPKKTISELSKVLSKKFLIRLALKIKNVVKDEKTITDLRKSIEIDKLSGNIRFDPSSHLQKILNNNKLGKDLNAYLEHIEELTKKCNGDVRHCIRGHDYIHLLFVYIDKIKNDIKLSEEMLERSLFQSIDFSEISKEPLFIKVLSRYS